MKVKCSIITVSYNSKDTIEQTIQSVLSQSYTNLEYIIVDGASTDGTVDIIRHYAAQDNRIRFVSEPDNGIYDAMNKGIQMATGDIIGLLNSNDYYESEALENIVERIPPNESFYVVYGMVRMLKGSNESMVLINNHSDLPERMILHPACFVSKEAYANYQYDTQYKSAADYDLFLRLYQDKRICFIPVYKIITNFRMGGMSAGVVSFLETDRIKYKYGYLSKKAKIINAVGLRVKYFLKKAF